MTNCIAGRGFSGHRGDQTNDGILATWKNQTNFAANLICLERRWLLVCTVTMGQRAPLLNVS